MTIKLPPTDKAAHFGAGWIIAHLASLVVAWPWALAIGIAAGVAKEWAYDRMTGGDVDAKDAIATGLGAALCACALLLA